MLLVCSRDSSPAFCSTGSGLGLEGYQNGSAAEQEQSLTTLLEVSVVLRFTVYGRCCATMLASVFRPVSIKRLPPGQVSPLDHPQLLCRYLGAE